MSLRCSFRLSDFAFAVNRLSFPGDAQKRSSVDMLSITKFAGTFKGWSLLPGEGAGRERSGFQEVFSSSWADFLMRRTIIQTDSTINGAATVVITAGSIGRKPFGIPFRSQDRMPMQ
jgi:hypothetical protein